MELVLIRGLPGSGKTTMAKTDFSTYDHHEADHYFEDEQGNYKFRQGELEHAHAQCLDRAIKSCIHGNNVVVSNTFTQWWDMMPYLKMASQYGYDIRIIEAKGHYKNIHNVPAASIQRMADRWE